MKALFLLCVLVFSASATEISFNDRPVFSGSTINGQLSRLGDKLTLGQNGGPNDAETARRVVIAAWYVVPGLTRIDDYSSFPANDICMYFLPPGSGGSAPRYTANLRWDGQMTTESGVAVPRNCTVTRGPRCLGDHMDNQCKLTVVSNGVLSHFFLTYPDKPKNLSVRNLRVDARDGKLTFVVQKMAPYDDWTIPLPLRLDVAIAPHSEDTERAFATINASSPTGTLATVAAARGGNSTVVFLNDSSASWTFDWTLHLPCNSSCSFDAYVVMPDPFYPSMRPLASADFTLAPPPPPIPIPSPNPPPPIPNHTLPSYAVSLIIVSYFAIVSFYHYYTWKPFVVQ